LFKKEENIRGDYEVIWAVSLLIDDILEIFFVYKWVLIE
jgi:hypothetical protein